MDSPVSYVVSFVSPKSCICSAFGIVKIYVISFSIGPWCIVNWVYKDFHYKDNLQSIRPTWPKMWRIVCQKQVSWAWVSYQIRKIAGCACAGNAGNFFPRHPLQRKQLVSDPGMHHGTCRDACRDWVPAVVGKAFPAFPGPGTHTRKILRIW